MLRLVTYAIQTPFETLRRIGSLDDDGSVLDLRSAYERVLRDEGDAHAEQIARVRIPDSMVAFILGGDASVAAADAALERGDGLRFSAEQVVLEPPLRPGKIICMGRNYREHAEESAMPVPDDFPRGFIKVSSTLVGANASVPYPWATKRFDFEAELVVVIAKRAQHVSRENALDYVYGYTIFNDLSARDWQYAERKRGNHVLGKNLDGTGPIGPAIVLRRDVDPSDLRVTQRVNGRVRQDGSTRQMIHDIPTMIAHWSRMTLEPGDVICTGTPEGVAALAAGEPEFLKPGDVVEAEVQGIGLLRTFIASPLFDVQGCGFEP